MEHDYFDEAATLIDKLNRGKLSTGNVLVPQS